MSLLNSLLELADDKTPNAIAGMLRKAKDLADEHLAGPERDLAKSALDKIAEHSDALAHLGKGGLIAVVTLTGFSRLNEAKLAYLMAGASFEERRRASMDSTEETTNERINRERAWADVQDTLKALGMIALKVLPLLLAAA